MSKSTERLQFLIKLNKHPGDHDYSIIDDVVAVIDDVFILLLLLCFGANQQNDHVWAFLLKISLILDLFLCYTLISLSCRVVEVLKGREVTLALQVPPMMNHWRDWVWLGCLIPGLMNRGQVSPQVTVKPQQNPHYSNTSILRKYWVNPLCLQTCNKLLKMTQPQNPQPLPICPR